MIPDLFTIPSARETSANAAGPKRRIYLVDDHPIVQQALAEMLNHEGALEVCGSSQVATVALQEIGSLKPALVILDLALAGSDGIELLKEIRARRPRQRILMLSMHDESLYALRALRAGAAGYIMKVEATEKLVGAIRLILEGGTYLSDGMQKRVLRPVGSQPGNSWSEPLDRLSDRELEVLRLLGQALGTRQIATALHLSVKTVESHRAHMKEKLNLGSGAELVRYAIRLHGERFDQPPAAISALPSPVMEVQILQSSERAQSG
jgi:DNA-binding NarL/FixJ family response regulator